MIFRRYNVLFLAYFLSEKNMCWGGIIFYQANIPSGIKVGLKSEISATDEWKSEISATDGGNRRFLLLMGEIGDFCYGWRKSEISATDGGNRRFLLRMEEIGDFCYGWRKSEVSATDGGNRRFLLRGKMLNCGSYYILDRVF